MYDVRAVVDTVLTEDTSTMPTEQIWAEFRFSVIGHLIAAPPAERGDLKAALVELATKVWTHPVTGEPIRFAPSTVERWYYNAQRSPKNRLLKLARRTRKDLGRTVFDDIRLAEIVEAQYREHPSWSYALHHVNLLATIQRVPGIECTPSYQSLRRFMRARGYIKRRRKRKPEDHLADETTMNVYVARERRSYEVTHVGGLWHSDFHHGRLRVDLPNGERRAPIALATLDDRSRVCCHGQWYLGEATAELVHGSSQGIMKRGKPAAWMTDRGAAMMSGEFREGLARLGILHQPTLPYSPEVNAKIERFWGALEGRLVAMVENVRPLTLEKLNDLTIAWIEMEYNRRVHSEIGTSPIDRFLAGPSVLLPSPSPDELRAAFRMDETRIQRRSDGTVTIEGIRYEVPQSLRHIEKLTVRYARWDMTRVDVVDERTGQVVSPLYPLDKEKNADGHRRALVAPGPADVPVAPTNAVAPYLEQLASEYAAQGLPPAWLSFNRNAEAKEKTP